MRGGLDLISPTAISGWAYHPEHRLAVVRVGIGKHLIAQSPIDQARPDVEDALGVGGNFGFTLRIPPDLPFLYFCDEPVVQAVSDDGSFRPVLRLQKTKSDTDRQLQRAMSVEYRGLEGHFDGLTGDSKALHGWCVYLRNILIAPRVFMQISNAEPTALLCDRERPGHDLVGLPPRCAFYFPLTDDLPVQRNAGSEVWFSYDPDGLLRLPQLHPCFLPEVASKPANVASLSHHSSESDQNDFSPSHLCRNSSQSLVSISDFADCRQQWSDLRLSHDFSRNGVSDLPIQHSDCPKKAC